MPQRLLSEINFRNGIKTIKCWDKDETQSLKNEVLAKNLVSLSFFCVQRTFKNENDEKRGCLISPEK